MTPPALVSSGMNTSPPEPPPPDAGPPLRRWLNPWRDLAAMLGLMGVSVTGAMVGYHPGLVLMLGWLFAIAGLVGVPGSLWRNRPETTGPLTVCYWIAGIGGLIGAFWASGAAGLSYARQLGEFHLTPPDPMGEAVAEPLAWTICLGMVVVGITATAHRLSDRQCLYLALYWLSFVPLTILLLKCAELAGAF